MHGKETISDSSTPSQTIRIIDMVSEKLQAAQRAILHFEDACHNKSTKPFTMVTAYNKNGMPYTNGKHCVSYAADAGAVAVAVGDDSISVSRHANSVSVTTGNGGAALVDSPYSVSVGTGFGNIATAADKGYSAAVTTYNNSVSEVIGDGGASVSLGNKSAACANGRSMIAAASGDDSRSAVRGHSSVSVSTGKGGASAAKGAGSISVVTGTDGVAFAEKDSAAVSFGDGCGAKGSVGSWLILAEMGDSGKGENGIKRIKAVLVDGNEILPDTVYTLRDGNISTVTESE